MPGFDWNGNGKSDAFDTFMDMQVMSSSSDDKSNDADDDNYARHSSTSTNQHRKSITQSQQNTQESNGSVIGKCALAIGLCAGAFALCMSGEIGELGMGLLLIGAAIVGYLILKK